MSHTPHIEPKPLETIEAYVHTALKEMSLQLKVQNLNKIEIDHLCWRCSNPNHYAIFMAYFCGQGKAIIKDFIFNKRRVSIFKLNSPISIKVGRKKYIVEFIRITDFKESSPHSTGWGHISFTIPPKLSLTEWMEKHPHIQFTHNKPLLDAIAIIEARTILPASQTHIRFNTANLENFLLQQKAS